MYSISNIPDYFRKRLKEGRTYAGFKTQEALADEMGVTRSSIAKWENGVNLPPLNTLLSLCNSLKCDIGYLFGEHKEHRRVAADICAETGLTEEAVETLMAIRDFSANQKEEQRKHGKTAFTMLDLLNHILADKEFFEQGNSCMLNSLAYAIGFRCYYEVVPMLEQIPQELDGFIWSMEGKAYLAEHGHAIVDKATASEASMQAAIRSFGRIIDKFADAQEKHRNPKENSGISNGEH